MLLLKSPIIKSDKKQEILDAIFGKNLSKMSILFMLNYQKKRAGFISDIAALFIAYKNTNTSIAKVTSAVPLSKAQKENCITFK